MPYGFAVFNVSRAQPSQAFSRRDHESCDLSRVPDCWTAQCFFYEPHVTSESNEIQGDELISGHVVGGHMVWAFVLFLALGAS